VAAAAEVYFGKTLDQLSIAEMATLAASDGALGGEPGGQRRSAKVRRTTCWGACGNSTTSPGDTTRPTGARWNPRLHGPHHRGGCAVCGGNRYGTRAGKYGDSIYTGGYRVFTTIDARLESAATVGCAYGAARYDRRHGWRGATAKVEIAQILDGAELGTGTRESRSSAVWRPAIVQSVEAKTAKIYVKNLGR